MQRTFQTFLAITFAFAAIAALPSSSHAFIGATPEQWQAFTEYVNKAPEYGGNCQLPRCQEMRDRFNNSSGNVRKRSRSWIRNLRGRLGLLRFGGTAAAGTAAFYTGWQIGTELRESFVKHEPLTPVQQMYANSWEWRRGEFLGVQGPMHRKPGTLGGQTLPAFYLAHTGGGVGSVRTTWYCQDVGLSPAVVNSPAPGSCPDPYPWIQTWASYTEVPDFEPMWVENLEGWKVEFWNDGAELDLEAAPEPEVEFGFDEDQLPEKTQSQVVNAVQTGPTTTEDVLDEQAAQEVFFPGAEENFWATPDLWGDPFEGTSEPTNSDSGGNTEPAINDPENPDECQRWYRPKVDTDPLKQPIGEQFPFGVPFWLYGIIQQFEAPSDAPSFTINFSGDNELVVDFGLINPIIGIFRALLLVLGTVGIVYLIAGFAFGQSPKTSE